MKKKQVKKSNQKHNALPFKVGDNIFVRTVTHYQVGKVTGIGPDFITLTEASWVADSGRFGVALASGALNEVEKLPDWVMIGRGAIVDVQPWKHELPSATK